MARDAATERPINAEATAVRGEEKQRVRPVSPPIWSG